MQWHVDDALILFAALCLVVWNHRHSLIVTMLSLSCAMDAIFIAVLVLLQCHVRNVVGGTICLVSLHYFMINFTAFIK